MKVVASIGCIISSYYNRNPGNGLQVLQYPRSDTLLRLLQGEDLRVDYSELRKWTTHFKPLLLKSFDPAGIDAFLWTSFHDHISKFCNYRGLPTCLFVLPENQKFYERFPLFPRLTLEERRANREAINRRLLEINPDCKRGLLIYDRTRLKNHPQMYEYYEKAEIEMIEHMSSLGWTVYLMPEDSPPAPGDLYWAHYQPDFMEEVVRDCLEELTQSIPQT